MQQKNAHLTIGYKSYV